MSTKSKSVLAEALALPREEQLALAERLFAAHELDEAAIDPAFLAELDARLDAYEQGQDKGEDAFEAIGEMRAGLRARRGA